MLGSAEEGGLREYQVKQNMILLLLLCWPRVASHLLVGYWPYVSLLPRTHPEDLTFSQGVPSIGH